LRLREKIRTFYKLEAVEPEKATRGYDNSIRLVERYIYRWG